MNPRRTGTFSLQALPDWKQRLLHWADAFPVCAYLDSNEYPGGPYGTWECLVAVGAREIHQAVAGDAFAGLQRRLTQKNDWWFGFLGYDLKNEVERLQSDHTDGIGLPDMLFFQPLVVAGVRQGASRDPLLEIHALDADPAAVFAELGALQLPPDEAQTAAPASVPLRARISHAGYLATVEAIRQHIVEGDVYELNLCQEFYAENVRLAPRAVFEQLNARARAPFSAYLRIDDRFLLCASPERFLRKDGQELISQPIKGTRRRHPDPETDRAIREELRHSVKDQAENVMIVDLVRNDLARHCLPGTIRVEELFGIYSFQTVHQMISTVAGVLRPEAHPVEALRDAFPMGSMTGAPKVMAMELIERYEHSRRGLFSGAVGYFTPEGNFDFNVVIRSILYNAATGYLSCPVGGAIVFDSVAEDEYEECLVKIQAIVAVLAGQGVGASDLG